MFWLALMPKMLLGAVIVVATAMLVERLGPLVGAMFMTLPVSAGPSYVFLGVDHGPAFLEQSGAAGLSGTIATGIFLVTYTMLAQGHGVLVSLGIALSAWTLTATMVVHASVSLPLTLALSIGVLVAGILIVRPLQSGQVPTPRLQRWWVLPMRAILVMLLIGIVLIAGREVGPVGAGIAAIAPVVLVSTIGILHPRIGGRATADIMIYGLWGMIGFALAIATLAFASVRLGSAAALSLALAVNLAWNGAVLAARRYLQIGS